MYNSFTSEAFKSSTYIPTDFYSVLLLYEITFNIIAQRCEKLSENKNIKAIVLFLNSTFNGRGGGKDFYAQGTINATKEEIVNKLLERASL